MNRFWLLILLLVFVCGCEANPSERNNTGNTLYDQGRFDSAIAAYQAAQVALPDSPEAYYNAASAYSQKADFDKAIELLQQALKTSDLDLKMYAYYNLGNIYFQMNRFDDAVDAYQHALLLNPNDDDARHNLELAIKRLVVQSATPISPTDQAADEGIGGSTPTSEMSSQPSAVISATADTSTSQTDTLTITPAVTGLPATISVDDAIGILDAVHQAQQSLSTQLLAKTPSAVNSNKDW